MPPRLPLQLLPIRHCQQHLGSYRSRSHNHSKSSTQIPLSGAPPVDDYYALLLSQPLPATATTSNPSSSPTSSTPPPISASSSTAAKARVIFGSRLAGPAERHSQHQAQEAEAKSRGEGEWIAGQWIPPRPEEPDNCCMSGCVNCVWEGYREEVEAWAERRKEARKRVRDGEVARVEEGTVGDIDGEPGGIDIDSGMEDGLMEGIPVGIREFMRTEKRLGERRRRDKMREKGVEP